MIEAEMSGKKYATEAANPFRLSEEYPKVSIVIPMYNERDHIVHCLDSLINQTYPLDKLEICVVDGHSDDGCREQVDDLKKRYPNIRLLSNPARRTPISLNMGIKAASGEVVIILGAHTRVAPDFVAKNIHYMKEKDVPCVGGTQINQGFTYIQQAIGNAMASPFGIMSAPYRYRKSPGFVDTVVYAAYHRDLFKEVGYFDEEKPIAEDAELNWRIRKAGYKIFFTPEIISYYIPRKNLIHLFRQFYRYGIFRVNVVKKHLDALKVLHLIPALFVLFLAGSAVLSVFNPLFGMVFLYLLAAYGIYLVVASLSTAARSGWRYLPVLPIAFMMMHLSFGLGFLVGVFRSQTG